MGPGRMAAVVRRVAVEGRAAGTAAGQGRPPADHHHHHLSWRGQWCGPGTENSFETCCTVL